MLFTVAEARTYDKRQLENATVYPDALIESAEAAIRERFERIIGVALEPATVTEYYDGDDTPVLYLRHHNSRIVGEPVEVSEVVLIYSDGSELALDLGEIVAYADKIVRRWSTWPSGQQNIRVTYTHGYKSAPAEIKAAALQALLLPPPDGLVPSSAPSTAYEGTEGQIKWTRIKDPDRGRWFGHEAVDSVLRDYRRIEMAPLVR